MRVLFFDTTWNQILRFGNLISEELKKLVTIKTYGLVYETSGKKVIPENYSHHFDDYLVTTKISDIEDYINCIRPEVVVFAQNTIPDLGAIYFSQKVGAKVVMLQHGLLYDGASLNNVRMGEIIAALKMANKTLKYFNIMHLICKRKNQSFIKLLLEILKKKDNVTTTIQYFFTPHLRGECAFVIGSHWVDYYHENYGYPIENIYIMGNHDVDDLKDTEILENAICYIPSVHVEDGKVKLDVFNEFLTRLKAAIPAGIKLYIKLHPRSNKRIYTDIFGEENVEYISNKNLPYVTTYIGHNSSLLSKALQISSRLIVCGFKEEKDLFYKDFAFAVCDDEVSLKTAIKEALFEKKLETKKNISIYSYKNPIGAFKYCANKIVELYINN